MASVARRYEAKGPDGRLMTARAAHPYRSDVPCLDVDLDLDVVGTVLYPEEATTLRGRGYEVEVPDLGLRAAGGRGESGLSVATRSQLLHRLGNPGPLHVPGAGPRRWHASLST